MALSVAMVLSGLPREQFTEESLQVYSFGEMLVKSPNVSLVSIATAPSKLTGSEKLITESSELLLEKLNRYLDIIGNVELKFEIFQSIKHTPRPEKEEPRTKIMYRGRNILDLHRNLQNSWTFQPANLQEEVPNFSEDSSQYSRVKGVSNPWPISIKCEESDCGFVEPEHY